MPLLPILLALLLVALPCTSASADPFTAYPARMDAAREQAKRPVDQAALLERRVPELNVKAIPLEDVFDFVRDVSGLHLLVDWQALRSARVDGKTPVTVVRADVTVRDGLLEVLRVTGAGAKKVRLEVIDELAVVSTPDRLARMKALLARGDAAGADPHAAAAPPRGLSARIALIEFDPCLGDSRGLALHDRPLEAALEDLAACTNVPIRADWERLGEQGIDRRASIDARIPNVSLKCALVYLFTHIGALDGCDWREENGTVIISARKPEEGQ